MISTFQNFAFVAFSVVVPPLMVACGHTPRQPTSAAQVAANTSSANLPNQKCRIVNMGASWKAFYASVPELKANSDIGVVGRISSIGQTVKPSVGPVFRMVTITVDEVVHRRDGASPVPQQITFMQSGGVYDEVMYEVEDNPLFDMNENAVLYFEEYSPGEYRISGGPTGRFRVSGSTVAPVMPERVTLPTGTTTMSIRYL